jgi:arabinofuranosyltransferase
MAIKPSRVVPRRFSAEIIVISLLLLFILVIVLRAWMSDDAYITLRTVDNFINGYGLTWNISERVQPYTHPLWMFLLSFLYFFTREAYYTTIILSIVISFAAVVLYTYKIVRIRSIAILGILILILSRAFTDYSTSGLENPLSYLCLIIFFIIYFEPENRINKVFSLSLVASLGALNRMDTLLIYLPSLLVIFWRNRSWKTFWLMSAGQIPLLLWFGFSLFYYGFPFPNSAYAKLNTGIPISDLIHQGSLYFMNSIRADPITLIVIMMGVIIPLVLREKRLLPLSAGILLYLLYVLRIGGDFMSGRFFALPLLASLISLAMLFKKPPNRVFIISTLILILILGILSPSPTYRIFEKGAMITDSGIADERGFYHSFTGVFAARNNTSISNHEWAEEGRLNSERIKPVVRGATGLYGYYAGPKVYIIDRNGLADPLLARLHVNLNNPWRIGHFKRPIPPGYFETINTGNNVIENSDIKKLYDVIQLITRGEVFDPQRLLAIWRINTGNLFDQDSY